MNRIASLASLGLLALLVCGAFAFASKGTAAKYDCCYPGSPCCFEGSPCCEGLDCCYPGSPCCFEGSPCCTFKATTVKAKQDCCNPPQECCFTGTCCAVKDACCAEAGCCDLKAVKKVLTGTVQKKAGCCAGH